jgi:hypothetical protein
LWSETRGDPHVCLAILDGPVDVSHPTLRGADLTRLETLVPGDPDRGPATQHGTHIGSLIFGRHDGPVPGVAPDCRGLIVPIFESADETSFRPCSQLDLARAISMAARQGAHVINVSGGQFAPLGAAHPLLTDVVRDCARRGVLIVAAAGNEGCECLHVPAALDSVLAVGGMDERGEPLEFSNWGSLYRTQGILAPGENRLGAAPGGGTVRRTGTSYAAALVSGVVALLLSWLRRRGREPDPRRVREAILRSAIGCEVTPTTDCRRLLAGRLNVNGAVSILTQGMHTMSETVEVQANGETMPMSEAAPAAAVRPPLPAQARGPEPDGAGEVGPSACAACQRAAGPPPLVYALGQIGYDFITEARLTSLTQRITGLPGASLLDRMRALDPERLLAYLDNNPWDAGSIEWTLNLDGIPVYAIRPQGPFAPEVYRLLRTFLGEQLREGVERVSIPGWGAGSARLLWGQTVPVVIPEPRGMHSWTTAALVEAVAGPAPGPRAAQAARTAHERRTAAVRDFLDRVYHEVRNLGAAPHDRAINYAATNAVDFRQIYEAANRQGIQERMDLESIRVVPSPLARPGSECLDVELYFFFPERQVQTVRKVFRYTVDVSDVVPVSVGPVRSWFTR